ncbi:protein CLMP1 [Sesamum angolense]|uniref:Protein CLMP1 n=1 Tax=Sesamum angolense TaxID=2727404 RepID=A0AAE1WSN7_9LAMI|nr:protein CLMP1 [Sesamum angolense]
MGKSGGWKKKSGTSQNQVAIGDNPSPAVVETGVNLDSSAFLKRAHEIKEEGNRSNKAACLMQMKPIDYDAVISECTLALQVQPQFVRALLRRARAFEAVGKRPSRIPAPSPAALGASAVRGTPVAGLGPCLPARHVPKKPVSSVAAPTVPSNKLEKLYPIPPVENSPGTNNQLPKVVLKSSNASTVPIGNAGKDNQKEQSTRTSGSHPLCEQAAHSTYTVDR